MNLLYNPHLTIKGKRTPLTTLIQIISSNGITNWSAEAMASLLEMFRDQEVLWCFGNP